MAMISSNMSLNASIGSIGKDDNFDKMFRNFTFKTLQIIIQSRIETNSKVVKEPQSADCFGITVLDDPFIEEKVKQFLDGVKSFPVREQSVCVEIPLVTNDGDVMFLENWDLTFNLNSMDTTASKLQQVFTRMTVAVKTLICSTRATPAYKLARNQGENRGGYRLDYRLYLGKPQNNFLGDGFRTHRAGAVPTSLGLMTINVSFRTKLLLSPAVTASAMKTMELTDNHFRKEYRANYTFSDPQPCFMTPRSPTVRSGSPYYFAASPGSLEKENSDFQARFQSESTWSNSSILNLDEIPEHVVGAFANRQTNPEEVVEKKIPFESLMRSSILARQERQQMMKSRQRNENSEASVHENVKSRSSQAGVREEEKENIKFHACGGQMLSEEDFVILDRPPFAVDDPRDPRAILGVFAKAPKSLENQECVRSLEEFLSDVAAWFPKLDNDKVIMDEFCQSVTYRDSEEEGESPFFS